MNRDDEELVEKMLELRSAMLGVARRLRSRGNVEHSNELLDDADALQAWIDDILEEE